MRTAIIFLIIIFTINCFGMYYNWYGDTNIFDMGLHFSGGFFVAMFFWHYLKSYISQGVWFKNLIIITGSTLLIGVLWELAEFTASKTLVDFFLNEFGIRTYFIGDLVDTMGDLFLDLAGAVVLFVSAQIKNKR